MEEKEGYSTVKRNGKIIRLITCPMCEKKWTHPDLEFDPNPEDKTCSRKCLIKQQAQKASEFICMSTRNSFKLIACPTCGVKWICLDEVEPVNDACSEICGNPGFSSSAGSDTSEFSS